MNYALKHDALLHRRSSSGPGIAQRNVVLKLRCTRMFDMSVLAALADRKNYDSDAALAKLLVDHVINLRPSGRARTNLLKTTPGFPSFSVSKLSRVATCHNCGACRTVAVLRAQPVSIRPHPPVEGSEGFSCS